MKTIIEKSTNTSVNLLTEKLLEELMAGEFIKDDLPYSGGFTTDRYEIVDVVDVPDDWAGGKYLYKNGQWSLNPVDPRNFNI